jgi:hypothetical protein
MKRMPLTTNLAPRVDRLVWPLALAGWLGTALAVAALAGLLAHRAELEARLPAMEARLERLAARRDALPAAALPPADALAALRDRVARIDALAGAPAQPPLAVLGAVEQALPPEARVVSLRLDVEAQVLGLVAEAPDSAALAALMTRLEQAGPFGAVHLERQQEVGTQSRRRVRAELRLRLRGA